MAKIGGYVVKIGSYRAKSGAIGPRLGALWPRLRHLDSILWAPGPRFRPLSLRMVALGPQSGAVGLRVRDLGPQLHFVLRSCATQIYSGMFLLYNFFCVPPNEMKLSGIMYLRIFYIPTKFHRFRSYAKENIEKNVSE